MVQSDALSWWPDLIPDEDHNNEDMMLLLDNLFLNLFNITLQEWILSSGWVDKILKTFLPSDPLFGTLDDPLVTVEWHYWWPRLWTFVQNYVKGCGICQQYKINRLPFHPLYMPIPPSTNCLFTLCSMDLITDLHLSHGFGFILVMVDCGLTNGGDFTSLQKNDHCRTSGRTTIGTPLQTVWTSWQIYLWQRTPICCLCSLGTTETLKYD